MNYNIKLNLAINEILTKKILCSEECLIISL